MVKFFISLLVFNLLNTNPNSITANDEATLINNNPAFHAIDFISEAFNTAIRKEPKLSLETKPEKRDIHKLFRIRQAGSRIAEEVNSISQSKGALALGNNNSSNIISDIRSVFTNQDDIEHITQVFVIELGSQKRVTGNETSELTAQNRDDSEFFIDKSTKPEFESDTEKTITNETDQKDISNVNQKSKNGLASLPKGFVRVRVKEGRITGNTTKKLYKIEGGVEVFYDDMKVSAESADLDQNEEKVDLIGEVNVNDKEFSLKADELHIDFKAKSMQASKFVQFGNLKENTEELRDDMSRRDRIITSFKNKLSKIYCSELKYQWETGDFEASGQVKITQEGLVGSCDFLKFEKEKKVYTLNDNVFLEMTDFQWLFNNKIIEEPDRKVTEVIAKQPASITAKSMIINDETQTIILIGDETNPAKIFQKDKYILANKLVIDEERKLITGEQNVSIYQDNADWLIEGDRIRTSDQDPETLKQLKNPLEIKAASFKYFYEKKELELLTNVNIVGSNRKATCDKLTYNDIDGLLTLSGNVTIFNGQKEKIQSQIINIDTRARKIILSGITNGFFAVDKDKSGKPELTESPGKTGTTDVGKIESDNNRPNPKTDENRPNIIE